MSTAESNVSNARTVAEPKARTLPSVRVVPVLATLVVVALALGLGWQAWRVYMATAWTRDATVRAYVVGVAPQVAGQIVKLPVADNQFVHKGDLLLLVDPTDYAIAVRQAQAAAVQAQAVADNARAEMIRREKLTDIAVTAEEKQTYISDAAKAEAAYQSALANLDQARVNFKRTRVLSPVNGYVTNLAAQLGDYTTAGQRQISVIDADSFWVDAYFEETQLGGIRDGDEATIKLMGYAPLLRGRVQGLARGINVANATPDSQGLASVNPIFTFVRLAQRVPVRIKLEEVPKGIELVAGMTATVQIEPREAQSNPVPAPVSAPVTQAPPAPAPAQPERLAEASPPAPSAATQAPVQAQEQAAAAAASADLKTLGQQMAANPPSGGPPVAAIPPVPAGSPAPSAQNGPTGPAPEAAAAAAASADIKTLEHEINTPPPSSGADQMPATEFLGKTYDLFGGEGAAPAPRHASDPLRRRAHGRSRHYQP